MYDLIDVVHQTAKDERGPEEAKNVLRLFVCDWMFLVGDYLLLCI